MAKRRVGRPKGKTKYREPTGCKKISVYRRRHGRIIKTKGYVHKACF